MIANIPKRVLRRYLYEFKVPQTYRTVTKAIDACVNEEPLPSGVKGADLLRIKRALEAYRKREGKILASAAAAETALLETAADLGDNDAIALLCGARLVDAEVTKDDWKAGSHLLKQLMDRRHPLAFKVSGDLAYQMGRPDEAYKFYELALEGLEDPRLRTECFRNIGHIAFRNGDLIQARTSFSSACKDGPDPKQVADCHFYLAQLREANRDAARVHLEAAAAQGLREAFTPLGMMLLNHYGEARQAKEWLTLGCATDPTGEALVGLFDAATRLNDNKLARKTLEKVRAHANADTLIKAREYTIDGPEQLDPEPALNPLEPGLEPGLGPGLEPMPRAAKSASRWEF